MRTRLFSALIVSTLLMGSTTLQAANAVKIEDGKEVTLLYKLSVDGTLIETADAKHPFKYIHGKKQIVPGLEKGLVGLGIGDKKTIKVAPEEAYGLVNPKALQEIPKDKLPPNVPLKKGMLLEARSPQGQIQLVKIVEIKPKSVVIDFNHMLAGKELEFQVEVTGIK